MTLQTSTVGDHGVVVVYPQGDYKEDWTKAVLIWMQNTRWNTDIPREISTLPSLLYGALTGGWDRDRYGGKLVGEWGNRPEILALKLTWPIAEPWRLRATALVGQNQAAKVYVLVDADAWIADWTEWSRSDKTPNTANYLGISEDGHLFLMLVGDPQPETATLTSGSNPAAQSASITVPNASQSAQLISDATRDLQAAGNNVEAALLKLRQTAANKALTDAVARTNAALGKLVRLANGI